MSMAWSPWFMWRIFKAQIYPTSPCGAMMMYQITIHQINFLLKIWFIKCVGREAQPLYIMSMAWMPWFMLRIFKAQIYPTNPRGAMKIYQITIHQIDFLLKIWFNKCVGREAQSMYKMSMAWMPWFMLRIFKAQIYPTNPRGAMKTYQITIHQIDFLLKIWFIKCVGREAQS